MPRWWTQWRPLAISLLPNLLWQLLGRWQLLGWLLLLLLLLLLHPHQQDLHVRVRRCLAVGTGEWGRPVGRCGHECRRWAHVRNKAAGGSHLKTRRCHVLQCPLQLCLSNTRWRDAAVRYFGTQTRMALSWRTLWLVVLRLLLLVLPLLVVVLHLLLLVLQLLVLRLLLVVRAVPLVLLHTISSLTWRKHSTPCSPIEP